MSKTPEEMAEEYSFNYMLLDDPKYAMSITKKAFLAGYKAAQQWISVKDRLPTKLDITDIVLVWRESWKDYDTVRWQPYGFDDVNPETITHWMPLPAAPKEEK